MSELAATKELKIAFEEVFPEYAARLNAVSTQSEIEKVYNEIVDECYQEVQNQVRAGALSANDESGMIIAIKQKDYERMLQAENGDIQYYITKLLNAMENAKAYMDEKDFEQVAACLLAGGAITLTASAAAMAFAALKAGATTFAAALSAVTSCSAGIAGLIGLAVVLIVIPLIYFIEKPAATIMLLINDTDETINMVESYCKHGKTTVKAKEIDPKDDGVPGAVAGIFVSTKCDGALIGTNVGYHFRTEETKRDFFIGMECPLVEMQNSCYCSFDGSVQSICDETSNHKVLKSSAEKNGLKVDIKCNSKKGSVAYYMFTINNPYPRKNTR